MFLGGPLSYSGLFFIFAIIFLCGCEAKIANRDSKGTTIVCFGDSLTAGFGAEEGKDYPSIVRAKVDITVINAGMSGDTTADGLRRLETDVLQHDPKVVIITLGANDFLRRIDKEETLRNMATIFDRIRERGAMVVWATVNTSLWGDVYGGDFKRLAREKQVLLIPNVLKDILFDPRYKYDQIHPNSDGYRLMAERIYQRVKPLLK